MLKNIIQNLLSLFDFYLICGGDKGIYLRKQGGKIGERCDLITSIRNFGTEPYLVRIGDDVTVTDGVKFITHDASTRLFRYKFNDMSKFGNIFAPIIIGNNCFIGVNVILLPGVRIGDNCIIGAGSVVKSDFPSNSVIAGVPAKVISSLDDYIEKVKREKVPINSATRTDFKK